MANAVISFFGKVGGWLKRLFTNTTIEHQILAAMTYLAPLLEGILSFAEPAIAPLVKQYIDRAMAALATVTAVVDGAKVAPGTPVAATVTAALNSVKANLGDLLTEAEVKNSTNYAKIEAAANTIIAEAEAALAAVGSQPAA